MILETTFSKIWWRLLLFAAGLSPTPAKSSSPAAAGMGQDKGPDDLKGLRRMDPQAITQVHNRYFHRLFKYARFRLDDEKIAEDIAGEAFMRLLESLHAGKGPRTSVGGWLMRTVSNLVNDHYRRHYARPTAELSEKLPAENPGPVFLYERSEEAGLLHRAMETLTSEQQQVLALRFGSGYSLAETAQVMEKKVNAVKALQFRAIGALRREMEKYDG